MKWYKITLFKDGRLVEKHEYLDIDEKQAKTIFRTVCDYSGRLYGNYRRHVRLYEVRQHTDGNDIVVQETNLMKYDVE